MSNHRKIVLSVIIALLLSVFGGALFYWSTLGFQYQAEYENGVYLLGYGNWWGVRYSYLSARKRESNIEVKVGETTFYVGREVKSKDLARAGATVEYNKNGNTGLKIQARMHSIDINLNGGVIRRIGCSVYPAGSTPNPTDSRVNIFVGETRIDLPLSGAEMRDQFGHYPTVERTLAWDL